MRQEWNSSFYYLIASSGKWLLSPYLDYIGTKYYESVSLEALTSGVHFSFQ